MFVRFLIAAIFLFNLLSLASLAQPVEKSGFIGVLPNVPPPYAGKYEARVGGSRESEGDKLRLDIGASVDILMRRDTINALDFTTSPITPKDFSFGVDFFTWTRLRAAGGFKFPVEAVDYYFGVNGALHYHAGAVSDIRLRLAHISAHLVDGDPSFTSPEQQYITYSREFLDAMIGFNATDLLSGIVPSRQLKLRPYVGGEWIFHTIPDTLGVLTPYAGLDATWQPRLDVPLALRFGYELRLNTELVPIGERLLRLGLKFGNIDSRGVVLEGSFYSGRSPYGQHFHRRETFSAIGFAVEF